MTHQEAYSEINNKPNWQTLAIANLGRTQRKMQEGRRKMLNDQHALIVASALLDVGGTFEFTEEHRKFGYSTIFSAMAGELHEQGATPKERALNSDEYEHVYRQGLSYLNQKLLSEWNATVIYSVPRKVNDKAIAFITTNPDLVVNENGDTASEIFLMREQKRCGGQLQSSATKLVRSQGVDKAMDTLLEVVNKVHKMVMIPEGNREFEFDEPQFPTLQHG